MKAAAPPDAAVKPPSKKKAMIGAAVAVLALGGGGAGWFFMHSKGGDDTEESAKPSKKKKKPKAHAAPVFAPLEVFTVNLQPDGGEESMLQTTITLEVMGPEQADLIKAHMPKVRSRVLLLLSAKKASDVKTVEGKNKLAEEILEALKKPFGENDEPQEVNEVMFTQFIIQPQ
ncbi:flagellar basal body-associated protein FliL [Massilia sp. P8910]|uniref:flagellar basal body-associated protein FliL n=1 Tax=Massilia antarctica TaxID=2765360 RepID=UPI001E596FD4|nr:flagellar basal body-associated protein FliL [Massilia antarctica]MCE3605933.1 flagellar basal body-associated protein FliL [Massilia antarctica]